MPVMNIRKVLMFVGHNDMFVPMRVRGGSRKRNFMHVLMVRVVRVAVLMGLGVVRVLMSVMLGQVQPYAYGH